MPQKSLVTESLVTLLIQVQTGQAHQSHSTDRVRWAATHSAQPAEKRKRKRKQPEVNFARLLREVESLNKRRSDELTNLIYRQAIAHPRKVWRVLRGIELYLAQTIVHNQRISFNERHELIFDAFKTLKAPVYGNSVYDNSDGQLSLFS